MNSLKCACAISFLAVGAITVPMMLWLNVAWLNEAFGDGPPYYGRSTNMDKWRNPVPALLVIDGLALLIIAVPLLICRRWRRL